MLPIKPNSNALSDCIGFYLEYCIAKGQSQATIVSKEAALSLFHKWVFQNVESDIQYIDVTVLESYQNHLIKYRKQCSGQPLSRGTIRYRLTVVKVMLRTLYAKGIVRSNNFELFDLPKIGRRLPKPVLSEKEVIQVLSQAEHYGKKGIRDRAIMEVYYASGIRRFELSNLRLNDIDFEQFQLRVEQGKGFKDRYVPIAKRACFWIYKYLKEVRNSLSNEFSGDSLFLANNGKPFKATQLSELVAKYIKLANIQKRGGCNQYRHAAATHMVDNGADIRHVQEFLGHADLSTTQVYVHVSMAKLKEVYSKTHPAAK
ncbi:tyrosine-type recombinase/integrase [Pseudoalteromonas luteoviolacea]|uniref:Integrase n=1 Tax=Pseudoalteromonas luteoviolacea S4060-1 TaxID=1365257 RepID=A0A161YI83_9GAMM|nr:tyrosine-type recombinase/integrase [Pseudoalteromonas luteoviolacea]KZN60836.1 hypothetical protein N478_25870 [Pseudoalteromonas luteoviolacea S4060-1]